MLSKTEDEKLFNKQAKKYGITAFTAQNFKKDEDLKKALNSFVSCRDFVLEDDFSNLGAYDSYYFDFFAKHNNYTEEDIHTRAEEVESTQKLFELFAPVHEIACREYYQVETQGFVHIHTAEGIIQDTTINDKIEQWHKIRREIDQIKPFIKKMFPRWEKVTKEERKNLHKEIKSLIQNLKNLENDTVQIKRVDHFLDKYYALNKISSFKADILFTFHFPHIISEEIAQKIVKNSKK